MTIETLNDGTPPEPELAAALGEFERSFQYPLGEAQCFHISHGTRYLTFFQAMGPAHVFVAASSATGQVLGTIACIERKIFDGSQTLPAAYFCDLKVAPGVRGGRVLPRLMHRAAAHCAMRGLTRAWSVVMRGTSRTPAAYTGRLEIPAFVRSGEIMVLRLGHREGLPVKAAAGHSAAAVAEARARLPRPGYAAGGGNSGLRSEMEPVHFITAGGDACGTLEDTRRGKRLLLSGGGELHSAHLSGFAFADAASGAQLLRSALGHVAARGVSGLFVALPMPWAEALRGFLTDVPCTLAPADVYTHGLPPHPNWWLDTADI